MQSSTFLSKPLNYRTVFIEAICYAYILLFLYAAIYKLLDYRFFELQLEHSPLLGPFSSTLAWLVPVSEIIAAILLIVPRYRYIGLWLSGLTMLGFTAYIIYILSFSSSIPCGCGGILASMGWKEHLVFNSVFVALAALAIAWYPKRITANSR